MNFLVVGLGNIGSEYAGTRHNMGFIVLDAWAQASNIVFSAGRYGALAEVSEKGHKLILLKPSTYVNESGKAVRYWMQEKKIPIERVIVLCDDLHLPFGSVRMRAGGSDGGHNGLKNITELLCSQNYARIRMGIGNDFPQGRQVEFVLEAFRDDELKQCGEIAERVVEGVKLFATQGVDKAMNIVNVRKQLTNTADTK